MLFTISQRRPTIGKLFSLNRGIFSHLCTSCSWGAYWRAYRASAVFPTGQLTHLWVGGCSTRTPGCCLIGRKLPYTFINGNCGPYSALSSSASDNGRAYNAPNTMAINYTSVRVVYILEIGTLCLPSDSPNKIRPGLRCF